MEKCAGIPRMKMKEVQGQFKTTPHPCNVDFWRWKQRCNGSKTRCKEETGCGGNHGTKAAMLSCLQLKALMSGSSCLPTTFTIGSSARSHTFQVNPGLSDLCEHHIGGFNCEIKTDLQIENKALYQWNCLEGEGLSVMAGSTSTAAVNVQKPSSGTRRKRSMSQPKWLWGYMLCGMFSVTEWVPERGCQFLTASSMSIFFHCRSSFWLVSVQHFYSSGWFLNSQLW